MTRGHQAKMFRGPVASVVRLLLHRSIAMAVGITVLAVRRASALLRRRERPRYEVCIESGRAGFDLIEVKELVRSAQERYGSDRVLTHVVRDRRHYLLAIRSRLREGRPRRYWVDPRSGAQTLLRALLQSIGLAHLLAWYGVTPVVWLTDVPVRRWRLQAEILSAADGAAFILMDPMKSDIPFAHGNFIGPVPPPFSTRTLRTLRESRRSHVPGSPARVMFAGSLYEPRRSILLRIRQQLREDGIDLEIHARELGAPRISDEEYWALLSSSDIIVTTAAQVHGSGIDASNVPHLIYRYSEALLAGAALVAPLVPGSEHIYRPGLDYLSFDDEHGAVRAIRDLCGDRDRRLEVARSGHRRAMQLVHDAYTWQEVERTRSWRRVGA